MGEAGILGEDDRVKLVEEEMAAVSRTGSHRPDCMKRVSRRGTARTTSEGDIPAA